MANWAQGRICTTATTAEPRGHHWRRFMNHPPQTGGNEEAPVTEATGTSEEPASRVREFSKAMIDFDVLDGRESTRQQPTSR